MADNIWLGDGLLAGGCGPVILVGTQAGATAIASLPRGALTRP
jgi:hypothetical protein